MTVESRKIQGIGLKDHQISQTATALEKTLRDYYRSINFPESLRSVLVTGLINALQSQGLKIDKTGQVSATHAPQGQGD